MPARNALLNLGEAYTVIAEPGKNSLFLQWGGTLAGTNPIQSFIMTSGAEADPEFVTNFFLANPGPFNGLFAPAAGPTAYSAGKLQDLTIHSSGRFTGVIKLGSGSYTLAGAFNASAEGTGSASRTAAEGGVITASLTLAANSSPPLITVILVGQDHGGWYASVQAYPSVSALASSRATMLISPYSSYSGAPPGDGFVSILIQGGAITVAGVLADGTSFNASAPPSMGGRFPLYASLYHNGGFVWGWLMFENGSPSGSLVWAKPEVANDPRYPAGFTVSARITGSSYVAPAGNKPVINLGDGTLEFTGGFLVEPLVFDVALGSGDVFTALNSSPSKNSLTGSVAPSTGLVNFAFGTGNGSSTTNAYGVILQI